MKGAVSTGIAVTIAIALIGGVATSVVWIQTAISSAIAPVDAKANQNTADISGLHTDISWIKAALDHNGIRPKQ